MRVRAILKFFNAILKFEVAFIKDIDNHVVILAIGTPETFDFFVENIKIPLSFGVDFIKLWLESSFDFLLSFLKLWLESFNDCAEVGESE